MTSKPGKQTITIHILSNISRCKGYQTITFSQLIQYNMRNIFFKKNHTQNVVEKPFPNPFLKNQNRAYLWITYVQVVFIACQVQGYRSILKLSCWPLAFTSYKAFFKKKTKRVLKLVSLPHLGMIFGENYLSCCILLTDQISLSTCLYSYCLLIMLWHRKFWNWPNLCNQAVFSTWPKS